MIEQRSGSEVARFWDADSVPLEPCASRADLEARAAWSALAEATDAAARYLWLSRGPVDALALALDGSIREIAVALEEAAHDPEAGQLHVTAVHESMKIRDARSAAEKAKAAWEARASETRYVLEHSSEHGIRLIRPGEAGWPAGLSRLAINAPFALWCAGGHAGEDTDSLRSVALVGSRGATRYGTGVAHDFASALAERGVRVVSGGALGIDAAAHAGALAARSLKEGGGGTVAFLAGGLDDYYPRANAALLTRVRNEGGLFSEAPIGTRPTRWRFLSRNRLIAAASDATIVIEAAWRSGALSTAAHADSLSLPVGAVPGPVTSAESSGCHRLIAERGAQLVSRVEDVELMISGGPGYSATVGLPENSASPGTLPLDVDLLGPVDRLVFDGIPRFSAIGVGELASLCALDPEQVAASLTRIELLGLVQVSRGRVRRTASGAA
ncbi:DNA-processing protein DprA [Dermabacter hominis]|uniref:DNA-processing protein DprA n=1 Tax=Dermabacter hominis TaxID=36740 RepID=UPI0021A50BD1|nr:DNA-processing protein DprA [Dermabacter hominis]MCT2056408.1 DNA-processing protein DprA [Dermabacter hominis]MCT2084086.1 DNA-processing protein DprA [Dermabacter hominis]MCT2091826.1 DNA-processing protein DprA [Dermabacter hominis]MCT2190868.1 DNA-processing protein DprA [Dermabacter hominis]MCT2227323.1 DNA-processing protein DprA [Dermabacter hominis]